MNWGARSVIALAFSIIPNISSASDFNEYILKSIDYLKENHSGGGYDIRRAFSHNINYGGKGEVKASSAPLTMCVAAVSEVIIYAMKIYAEETGDKSVFEKIPLTAWTKGNPTSLRANIFMYQGTGSKGTGHTLQEYKIGEELRFRDLKPGDFVNLNRKSGSGHAVIMTGYLLPNLSVTKAYSEDVVGFQYFSAQGKGKPDAGFAYRNAFFGDFCPSGSPIPRDCGVIRSNSRALLNTGRMWAPSDWNYLDAVKERRLATRSIYEDNNPELSRAVIDQLVDQYLQEDLKMSDAVEVKLNGVTTD